MARFSFQRLESRIAPSCVANVCDYDPCDPCDPCDSHDDDCDDKPDHEPKDKCHVKGNNGVGNGVDPQPPGNPPVNDGPGTGPGNPGNRK
ncbi:MAG TPA: hypothetical protein VM165_20280 [Planctomycetaceae bacterium]|nr:hypothetical protein [Planctomycetaceae bacterium]